MIWLVGCGLCWSVIILIVIVLDFELLFILQADDNPLSEQSVAQVLNTIRTYRKHYEHYNDAFSHLLTSLSRSKAQNLLKGLKSFVLCLTIINACADFSLALTSATNSNLDSTSLKNWLSPLM